MKYCVVNINLGKFWLGNTQEEIVNQVYEWKIDESRQIIAKVPGFQEVKFYSYSEKFTEEEMRKDAIQFLFGRLSGLYNLQVFINANP